MKQTASSQNKELKRLKKNVENSYDAFKSNYERFTKFRNFVFVSGMDDTMRAVNAELDRNSLEFNILEGYLNKLCGEYAEHEPGVLISSSDDYIPTSEEDKTRQANQIKFLEGHIRHVFSEAKKHGTQYEVYRDELAGGYSSIKIYTDYLNEKSFNQCIFMKHMPDQTMVGFDPLAQEKDKSDGRFCYQVVPYTEDEFKELFPDVSTAELNFTRGPASISPNAASVGPFNWSYMVGDEKMIVICDYYEKKKKKTKLYELTNDRIMTKEAYEDFLEEWNAKVEAGQEIALPPIVKRERMTEITTIDHYQFIDNKILSHNKTDYPSLPIKFADGNSVLTKKDGNSQTQQMTKPYFYHATGAQILKNYSGQCLANELETMRPAQLIAAIESIPDGYEDGYLKPQNMAAVVYNAFYEGNGQVPLPPPVPMVRQPIPAEISSTFMNCDIIMQNILGSFDASMTQLTEDQMSGKAIQEIVTLSNAGAAPYINNNLLAFQSCAQMIVDMIPLYYKTPRSLPIITAEGKHDYVMVNGDGQDSVMLDYEPGEFKVKVEMGISFALQQSKALQQLIGLAHAIPGFGQFLTDAGIPIVLDNVKIRNVETLRDSSEKWMQGQAQQKQAMMQAQAQQPKIEQQAMQVAAQQVQNEMQIGMAKIEQQAQAEQMKMAAKLAEIEMDNKKLSVDIAKILSEIKINEQKLGIEQQKADDQRVNTVIDAAIKQSEHKHGLATKQMDMAHRLQEADRMHERAEKEANKAMNDIARRE